MKLIHMNNLESRLNKVSKLERKLKSNLLSKLHSRIQSKLGNDLFFGLYYSTQRIAENKLSHA